MTLSQCGANGVTAGRYLRARSCLATAYGLRAGAAHPGRPAFPPLCFIFTYTSRRPSWWVRRCICSVVDESRSSLAGLAARCVSFYQIYLLHSEHALLISGARCRERAYLRAADRLARRDTLLA